VYSDNGTTFVGVAKALSKKYVEACSFGLSHLRGLAPAKMAPNPSLISIYLTIVGSKSEEFQATL